MLEAGWIDAQHHRFATAARAHRRRGSGRADRDHSRHRRDRRPVASGQSDRTTHIAATGRRARATDGRTSHRHCSADRSDLRGSGPLVEPPSRRPRPGLVRTALRAGRAYLRRSVRPMARRRRERHIRASLRASGTPAQRRTAATPSPGLGARVVLHRPAELAGSRTSGRHLARGGTRSSHRHVEPPPGPTPTWYTDTAAARIRVGAPSCWSTAVPVW
jgi:hypothetical protein